MASFSSMKGQEELGGSNCSLALWTMSLYCCHDVTVQEHHTMALRHLSQVAKRSVEFT